MPLFLASLWGGLISVLGTVVGRVLLSLGIGYASFTAVDTSIAFAKAQFLTGLAGLPATALGIMAVLKIGTCVSMLTSALLMRLTLGGMAAGTIRRMVIK